MLANQEEVTLPEEQKESKKTPAREAQKVSRRSFVLALVTIAQFMVIVDFTIVQIALPTIERELDISLGGLQWIVTAYGITLAGFLLLSGRASDVYGRKMLFIAGLVVFSTASLVGGLAPSEIVLVAARAVQGVGAAIASATALSILAAIFPEGRERNRALSVFAAVMGSGFAAGTVAGGFITATLGWRWVFDINVPIGIVAAFLSMKFVPDSRGQVTAHRHLDLPGAISVTGGLMLLVYALTSAQSVGLIAFQTLLFLGLSVLVLGSFLTIEWRSKAPLMPLGFLRRGTVFGANALGLLQVSAFVGLIFIMTIYLQQIEGYSALSAGLAFVPMGFVFPVASALISTRLMNRFGARAVLVAGMALQTVGYMLLTQISLGENYLIGLLPPMIIIANGAGINFTAINVVALTGTKRGEEGLASGLINTSRQIGGPVGLAVLVTIATAWTQALLSDGGVISSAAALVGGFQLAFVVATILAGIGVVMALLVNRRQTVIR